MKLFTNIVFAAATLITVEAALADPRAVAPGAGAIHGLRSLDTGNGGTVIHSRSDTPAFQLTISAPATATYIDAKQGFVTLNAETRATLVITPQPATVASR